MSSFHPTMDAAFREYADLELRCHYLLLDGQEHTPETFEVEDRMDALWEQLDEVQRRSLKGMGSDLNWVRRKGQPPPKGRQGPEEVASAEQQELVTAIGSQDWHAVLYYLRLCAPLFPIVTLAHLRGSAYEAIGLLTYASVFYEQAAEFDPANADIGVAALRSLEKTNPGKAIRRAATILASPLHYPPVVLALSAVMILRRSEVEDQPLDRQRLTTLLNDVVKRLQLESSEAARAMAYQAAASGFEILGNPTAALHCLNEGLQRAPNNDVLLVGKGLLLYGSQTDQAVQAFQKAARQGTPIVWPYVFLAHYYLLHRDFDASLAMGRKAWAKATTNAVRAELLEWQAICQRELHFPAEVVRSLFEKAVALDPSNRQITRNLAAFEDAVADPKESEWQFEEASWLKAQLADSAHSLALVGVS